MSPRPSFRRLPNVVLWAWQRREDLSFIDPAQYGVAYLACHVSLSRETIQCHWRDQPLVVPAGTAMVPCVRIDCDRRHTPSLCQAQIDKTAAVIAKAARASGSASVQIDFDAAESERRFYSDLIDRVRDELPRTMPLSITALASRCLYDNWIEKLPVAESVPMMFSLGAERAKILLYFQPDRKRDFLASRCLRALGISLEDRQINELMIPLMRSRKIPVRVYVFTRTAWTPKKLESLRSLLSR